MHCFLGQLRCRRYAKSPRNKHIQVLTLFQGGGYFALTLELLFAVDTLLGYAHWQLNNEKTSDESCTYGEMVRGLFHTRCQIRSKNQHCLQTISIEIDTEVKKFARLIQLFWPDEIRMLWGERDNPHYLPSSA
jgi:hypothetical protein